MKYTDLTLQYEQIRDVIYNKNSFAVAGHVSPDGDAIGSCMALALTLKKLNKCAHVLLEPFHPKFKVIPGLDLIYRGSLDELRPEVFFCLDCSTPDRLGAALAVHKCAGITVCVDHHVTNIPFCELNAIDPNASSTSELVYELIRPLIPMDKDAASAVYAGMVCDTGGFRYNATGGRTMRIAADLLELGIPFSEIYSELQHRHSFTETLLFRTALENMTLTADGRIADSILSYVNLTEKGGGGRDLDGVVEYLLNIRGVEMSALFYEKTPGEIKVSLRSKQADVSGIAAAFGGGGHKYAAGCTLRVAAAEGREQILSALCEKLA